MPADFASLMAMMRGCRICDGLELGPNPIFQLSAQARILVVGQAPGRITHAKDRPFDDPSGTRLRAWMGVDAATFYNDPRIGLFPMGLCFPGSGASGDLPPRPECARTWRAPVMAALKEVQLTLVLGQYAIGWHLPALKGVTVSEAVRRASDGADGVFVLPHPSPRNNRWLKTHGWFEAEVIPRIQSRISQLLDAPL